MAIVAQLVRALDCGSKSRGFEPRRSPSFAYFLYIHLEISALFGIKDSTQSFLD